MSPTEVQDLQIVCPRSGGHTQQALAGHQMDELSIRSAAEGEVVVSTIRSILGDERVTVSHKGKKQLPRA